MSETLSDPAGQQVVFTPRDAAAFLCISERLLWTLAKRGDIRSVKVGRLVRYYRPDLIAFMERSNGKPQH